VEANIAAGKSTYLNNLKSALQSTHQCLSKEFSKEDFAFVLEPVHLWGEMLNAFYRDPARYALPLQLLVTSTMIAAISEAIESYPSARVIICERSLLSSRDVFAKMLNDSGKFGSPGEPKTYETYESIFKLLCGDTKMYEPDVFMFIDSDPDECFQRINKRARIGEDKIDLEYLTNCHRLHADWIEGLKKSNKLVIVAEKKSVDALFASSEGNSSQNDFLSVYSHFNPLLEILRSLDVFN
jgi:deoxyadenosine/deoxycytidine kinase